VLKKDSCGQNCLQRFVWRCLRCIPKRWLGGTLKLHVVHPNRVVVHTTIEDWAADLVKTAWADFMSAAQRR
jgi:hypothetical protein